jgi:hypothetical protein
MTGKGKGVIPAPYRVRDKLQRESRRKLRDLNRSSQISLDGYDKITYNASAYSECGSARTLPVYQLITAEGMEHASNRTKSSGLVYAVCFLRIPCGPA